MSRRHTDAEIYEVYTRLGSAVRTGAELGLSHSYVSSRVRTMRLEKAQTIAAAAAREPSEPILTDSPAILPDLGSDEAQELQVLGAEVRVLSVKVDELLRLSRLMIRAMQAVVEKEEP